MYVTVQAVPLVAFHILIGLVDSTSESKIQPIYFSSLSRLIKNHLALAKSGELASDDVCKCLMN